jgi:rubrerythrin
MGTSENLQDAFAGESQANRKYLAFAKKAQAEGFGQIARLFRAAADAETVHAQAHLGAMGGVKGTADNLEAAIAGEGFEFQEMYPKFLATARQEQNKGATTSFRLALAVEQIHYGLYSRALEMLKGGKDMPAERIFVCQTCGNTVLGAPPDECPVCGSRKDRFIEVL